MYNRRKFIEAGAAVGVGAMLPWQAAEAAERAALATKAAPTKAVAGMAAPAPVPGVSPVLTKYLDNLPLPGAYQPRVDANGIVVTDPNNGGVIYDIPVLAFTQQLHSQLAPTPLWGYGGSFPSQSIVAEPGVPINVNWINGLTAADTHPVASGIDRTNIDGMIDPATGFFWPDQRIATHVHGAHVKSQSDGGPKTWYTGPAFALGATGYVAGNQVIVDGTPNGTYYTYDNNQPGTTLWFHDHAMGITRLNVYAGMAGFYILRDPREVNLNLPAGAQEIPLAIQDRIFNADGTLYYPPPPEVPEFFGDTMLVNGKVWPKHAVEPKKYRLRILNGCNARFLRMQLVQATAAGTLPASIRSWITTPFVQIGAEGGFFAAPAPAATVITLGPAERADVIVDFTAFAGKSVILYNDASTPFSNTVDTRGAIPEIMRFDVAATVTTPDTSVIPTSLAPLGGFVDRLGNPAAPNQVGAKVVVKTLNEITLANGMLMQLINMVGFEKDPLTGLAVPPDVMTLGTTEIWQITNTTVDTHPIHMHQAMFQVLDRQPFSVTQYVQKMGTKKGTLDPTPFLKGAKIPATPAEQGWKDTVQAHPGQVTRIAVTWLDYTGDYVYHCHILEHEEHDMMRAFTIKPAGAV
jgi:spore coat protein A